MPVIQVKMRTLDEFFDMNGVEKGGGGIEEKRDLRPFRPVDSISRKKAYELFRDEKERFSAFAGKRVRIEVYPYSTIKYTIRDKKKSVHFRICDIYLMCDEEEFRAIARKMLRHYLGRQNTGKDEVVYDNFVHRRDVAERWKDIRLTRGRGKRFIHPVGEHHDLTRIGKKVVEMYFPEAFPLPSLGWSVRIAKRRYGHYDSDHDTVIISRALDSDNVDEFVVEYVLYHEFLHIKHGVTEKEGRSLVHTKAFRRDEEKFEKYGEAKYFLKEFSPPGK